MRTVSRRALGVIVLALFIAANVAADGEEYLPYLFAAFGVTWAAFFAYAFFIARKQADLRRDIDEMRKQRLDEEGY